LQRFAKKGLTSTDSHETMTVDQTAKGIRPMEQTDTQTREQWLESLVEEMRDWFKGELPATVRVSTGFPSTGARGKVIGECWKADCASDNVCQVFVHPKVESSLDAAAIMAHELIHACRPDAKHGKGFREIAVRIGLEGKMTSTIAGPEMILRLNKVIERIGEYPHAALTPMGKKQSTRLIKVECPDCGYIARVTAKWLDDCGEPFCGQCETYNDEIGDGDVPIPMRMVRKG
jgi:hypothetical protein